MRYDIKEGVVIYKMGSISERFTALLQRICKDIVLPKIYQFMH